jgi:segregation and condensation protein B
MPMPSLKVLLEAALLAAPEPLSMDRLLTLFEEEERPERATIRAALAELSQDYADRGVELMEVASGFRLQVRQELAPWITRLWRERPTRYSRAALETLALIAYRQPITRGEIEEIRGVSVSSSTLRTLLDRGWIKALGQRDVPGRPTLYGTTRVFLDYFNLKSLADLPPLAELRDLEAVSAALEGEPNSSR